jgi:hypothetical protein
VPKEFDGQTIIGTNDGFNPDNFQHNLKSDMLYSLKVSPPGPDRCLKRGEQPAPHRCTHYTNRCSSRCEFCSYRMPGYIESNVLRERDEIPYQGCQKSGRLQGMGVVRPITAAGAVSSPAPRFVGVLTEAWAPRSAKNAIHNDAIQWCSSRWVRFRSMRNVDTYRRIRMCRRAYAILGVRF